MANSTLETLEKVAVDNKKLSLQPLKKFAKIKLDNCPILKEILMSESDSIGVQEFIAKSRVWVHILELEKAKGGET